VIELKLVEGGGDGAGTVLSISLSLSPLSLSRSMGDVTLEHVDLGGAVTCAWRAAGGVRGGSRRWWLQKLELDPEPWALFFSKAGVVMCLPPKIPFLHAGFVFRLPLKRYFQRRSF
jgi:hypothetical protein